MRLYLTPDLWLLILSGIGLLVGLWFAPRKRFSLWRLLSWLSALGLLAWIVWFPMEFPEQVSMDHDGNVVVAAEEWSRSWPLKPKQALKLRTFNASGRVIQTRSIQLPGRDDYDVTALQTDAAGSTFIALAPDPADNPLLIKVARDGRVLWTTRINAAWSCRLSLSSSEVKILGSTRDESRLICERFDQASGKLKAEGTWALSLWKKGGPGQICLDSDGGVSVIAGDSDNPVLMKLTPAGQMIWKTPFHDLTPLALYSDAGDHHYLGGRTRRSAAIMKFGPDGSLLWSADVFPYPSETLAGIHDVAGTGDAVFAYGIHRPFGDKAPKGFSRPRSFIAKLSASGTLEWRRVLKGRAGSFASSGTALVADHSGNAYIAGDGPGNRTRTVLSRFDSAGRFRWEAISPDPELMWLIILALISTIQWVKKRRERRAAQEQLSHS